MTPDTTQSRRQCSHPCRVSGATNSPVDASWFFHPKIKSVDSRTLVSESNSLDKTSPTPTGPPAPSPRKSRRKRAEGERKDEPELEEDLEPQQLPDREVHGEQVPDVLGQAHAQMRLVPLDVGDLMPHVVLYLQAQPRVHALAWNARLRRVLVRGIRAHLVLPLPPHAPLSLRGPRRPQGPQGSRDRSTQNLPGPRCRRSSGGVSAGCSTPCRKATPATAATAPSDTASPPSPSSSWPRTSLRQTRPPEYQQRTTDA